MRNVRHLARCARRDLDTRGHLRGTLGAYEPTESGTLHLILARVRSGSRGVGFEGGIVPRPAMAVEEHVPRRDTYIHVPPWDDVPRASKGPAGTEWSCASRMRRGEEWESVPPHEQHLGFDTMMASTSMNCYTFRTCNTATVQCCCVAVLRSAPARRPRRPAGQRSCGNPRSRLRQLHSCATEHCAPVTLFGLQDDALCMMHEWSLDSGDYARHAPPWVAKLTLDSGTPRGNAHGACIPRAQTSQPRRVLRYPRTSSSPAVAATPLVCTLSRRNLTCRRSATARWLRSWSEQCRYSGLNRGLGLDCVLPRARGGRRTICICTFRGVWSIIRGYGAGWVRTGALKSSGADACGPVAGAREPGAAL